MQESPWEARLPTCTYCLPIPAGWRALQCEQGAWHLRRCFINIQKFACLEELFEAAARNLDVIFSTFGLQRSTFDLMPAICFHFA